MLSTVKVVCFDVTGSGAIEVLGAAFWSQIVVVATVLGDLENKTNPF